MLRQIYAICSTAVQSRPQPEAEPATGVSPVLPDDLLNEARKLDTEHRAATGKPISRDTLRAQMRIGRDRASALVAVIRSEAATAAA
jgi:hypothetical protein